MNSSFSLDQAGDSELVYSTDPERNRRCLKCRKLVPECLCQAPEETASSGLLARIRLESAGRGGKVVTVIRDLPPRESFLKDLASELKKRCGAGGTYRIERLQGIIEIQGDKRDQVRIFLAKQGIPCKG